MMRRSSGFAWTYSSDTRSTSPIESAIEPSANFVARTASVQASTSRSQTASSSASFDG